MPAPDPFEAYLKQLRKDKAAIDLIARRVIADLPHADMRRYAVNHGLDEGSTYALVIRMGEALGRVEHRLNQALRHIEETEAAAKRYHDVATEAAHYRL